MCDLSNLEAVQQIQDDMYMQYFIGFSILSDAEPFYASLFVEFRKRLVIEQINEINEKILHMSTRIKETSVGKKDVPPKSQPPTSTTLSQLIEEPPITAIAATEPVLITHAGKLISDATACPQDISYPSDLNLLNDYREKAEERIGFLYDLKMHAAVKSHIWPGERNPIEGKFGQAKTAYGMNRIKARLQQTSESLIATMIMVLNLVKLTGHVPYCQMTRFFTYSA